MPETAAQEPRGVVALVSEFAGTGLALAHNTVQLAACEAGIVLPKLAARAGIFLGAVMLAVLGLMLALVGAAQGLTRAFELPDWVGYLALGALVAGGSALLARRMLDRLGDDDLAFPGTLAELEADAAALRAAKRTDGAAAGFAGGAPR